MFHTQEALPLDALTGPLLRGLISHSNIPLFRHTHSESTPHSERTRVCVSYAGGTAPGYPPRSPAERPGQWCQHGTKRASVGTGPAAGRARGKCLLRMFMYV